MKDNFIPLFQNIYAVYADIEEMLKGNLKYKKFKVLAINTSNNIVIEMTKEGHTLSIPRGSSSFIGLYEENEIGTDDFMSDLVAYYEEIM